ncbi:hypothetical protein CRV24_000422 [Beauveria bassiana]|nr:hypothetical protein CRV24_000422 [Beauveria bassiana]
MSGQNYNKTVDELAVKVGAIRPPLQDNSSTDSTSSKTNLSGSIIGETFLNTSFSDDAFFTKDLSLLPNNPKVIVAKLFEFTEWVYKARFSPEKTLDQAVKVYQDSLQCTSYHFGILCLLTPYVLEPVAIALDGTLPMAICKQAAGSIAELIQHYSRLYNDGQLFDFMAFFKAAALAFLEVCNTNMPM